MYYHNIKLEKTATPTESDLKEAENVEFSPILRTSFSGRIDAKTEPGDKRSSEAWRFHIFTPLVHLYDFLTGYSKDETLKLTFSLSTYKQERTLLATREVVHYLTKGFPFKTGSNFHSGQMLLKAKNLGVIREFSDYTYTKGLAREAKVNPLSRRQVLKRLKEIGDFFIKKPINILKEEINQSLENNQVNLKNERSDQVKQSKRTIEILEELDRFRDQNTGEITEELIDKLVEKLLPIRFELREELRNDLRKSLLGSRSEGRSKKSLHHTTGKTKLSDLRGDLDLDEWTPSPVLDPPQSPIPSTLFPPSPSFPRLPSALRPSSSDVLDSSLSSLSFPSPSPFSSLTFTEVDLLSLRSGAVTFVESHLQDVRQEAWTEALAYGVLSYSPEDAIDTRQAAKMVEESPLPNTYKKLSAASPRVYSVEKDNLFYCRKSLRLHAMSDLGLKDVDLQNAHAHIAIGLWGDRLPYLKEQISKGTLWDYYREIFESKGIPFHKSLIKQFHHATFLCGGERAYRRACHSYNNHLPKGQTLKKEDQDEIIKCFKNTKVCKELKALQRNLANEWDGQYKSLPTGERFKVKKTNWAYKKKTGIDNGNFNTVLSAHLQSYEMLVMSYMILRCQNMFIPLLWQHDGLTIKTVNSDTLEWMQKAINEFCDEYLNGQRIPLIAEEL